MSGMQDFNHSIIEEFRANGGRVGGQFDGAPMAVITTTGAKSGQPRTVPLMYLPDGDRVVIFASKAGAPTNPDWYHNIVANPAVTVEIGDDRYEAEAQVLSGAERDEIYARQAEAYPGFAEYQAGTERVIPVIALTRAA
ncbi:MAG: nitroreductase family deazaflavin-dependent oxidoreductase [Acidimicrobiales bacterium]|nr:nitroreductase family deazaflavin-dependent oxidoreductase [Acidimicrobiales bacterium]